MAKKFKTVSELLAEVKALATGKPKALVLQDATGVEITVETDGKPAVGDKVTIAGQPAPDGKIQLPDGKILEIAGGAIAEIIDVQDADPNQQMQAKIDALEANQAELVETVGLLLSTITSQGEEFKALARTIKSGYKAPLKDAKGLNVEKAPKTMADVIREQREAAKAQSTK